MTLAVVPKHPSCLESALAHVARGWRVFPAHSIRNGICSCGKVKCEHPAKHPRIKDNLKEATTDPKKIQEWWAKWPDANPAIATGVESGVVALDVDPRNGGRESLERLRQDLGGLPATVESLTGGGGSHLLYQHPGGYIVSRPLDKDKFPGLDIKADGGFIIAPGSRHLSGRTYEWELSSHPDEVPLAPFPTKLRAIHEAGGDSQEASGSSLEIIEGGRNNRLFKLACAVRRHADEPVVLAALREANKQCRPELNDQYLVEMAARVSNRYSPAMTDSPERRLPRIQAELMTMAYFLRSRQVPSELAPLYLEKLAKRKRHPMDPIEIMNMLNTTYSVDPKDAVHYAKHFEPAPEGITAADLDTKEFPDPVWIVPAIIPGGLATLSGKSKIGKSLLALDLAIGVASGGLVFGNMPTIPGGVIYLALEDHYARLQSRIRKIREDRGAPANLHLFRNWPRMNEIGELPHLEDTLDKIAGVNLVIIDTLAKIRPPSRPGDRYLQDYFEMQWLQSLASDRGIAILLIHHVNKREATGDVIDRISGTTAIPGAADTNLILERGRGEKDGVLTVSGRDVEDLSLAFEFDATKCMWVQKGDAKEHAQTEGQKAIFDVLKVAGEPMTPKAITEALNSERTVPISEESVKNMLRRMSDKKLIHQPGGKGGGYVVASLPSQRDLRDSRDSAA